MRSRAIQYAALSGLVIAMTGAQGDVAEHPSQVTDEELWAAMDLQRPGLEDVRAAVEAQDWQAAAEAWAEYFRRRERPTPHVRRDTWPEYVREHYPQLVQPIVEMADEIGEGDIAHGPYVLRVEGREIKWLENPTRDTNYVSAVGSQWFLNPLGRAYLLTGDERYPETFAWIFDSWYDHQLQIREQQGGLGFDPVFRAYYPGIRARILTDNYYCMAQSPALTPELHVKVMKQLLGCAAWLYAHESPRYRRGNQQVAAVLGCGIGGLVFPEFRDAEQWVELAERRMREHLQQDFFADGGHRELCTQYHKTVLRDIGYVALTAEANGRESLYSDPEAGPLIERACEWLAKLVMPTGETPALHSAVFATDYAVHLELAARHFGRPDFAWLAGRVWERGQAPSQKSPFGFANFMLAAATGDSPTPGPKRPQWLSLHLADSGFAVMRTGWEPEDRYLVAQYGWANTGHAYPAALHLLYESNGELVATSPGSPRSYRHPAYGYCHSTPSHNVVTIDGESYPGRPAPGGHLELLEDLPGAWMFSGYHEGYEEPFGATVHRDILVVKDGPVLVRDRIVGGEGHEAQWSFHTPLEMSVAAERTAHLEGSVRYTLSAARPDEIEQVTTEEHWEAVLPRDCQPEDCGAPVNVLRWHKRIGPEGAQFAAALFEGDGHIEAAGEDAYRLTLGDRRWLVLFGDDGGRVEVDDVAAIARCACVELRDGKPTRAWVFEGTRLTVGDRQWLSSRERTSREVEPPGL
ncbi:MAG: heparinase II/III family protein [Armatimonadota bacterium]|nr:heparinase II/III family protein [Armatimonadota bacterium]